MSKTTPIQEAIKRINDMVTVYALCGDKPMENAHKNIITQLTELLPLEKQIMQECYEAGREYQYRVHFDKPAPDFETFYSQYNLK